ncbi:DNA internalization-related competence protein ComEC/Rec2, partial [Candidatus Aminicenantes bacterium AH-873-B07]|nr:DNA internalization-related competence protein ComEC/Rec2 [Candidatus Aminicenantes bacterium AH-873-B07]
KLLPRSGYRNFNRPFLEKFLKVSKIHRKAYTKSSLLIEKIKSGNIIYPKRFLSFIKINLQKKIEKFFSLSDPTSLSQEGAILEALLLGERKRITDETTSILQKAGIYHLLAISGAHIAIISYLLFLIFRFFKIPRRMSYFLLIIILILYAFLVESRASVIRATVMGIAFLTGKLLWRDVNLINTISFSAFFLLIINPFFLFDIGFQLTFVAALSIILFAPKIISFLPHLPLKISELFGISLSAQLGVLPIIIYYFNRVTFSSIILNLIAVPLVGIIMGAGFIFLFVSFISSYLGFLLSKFIILLIKFLLLTSQYFNNIPCISFRAPTPFLWVILCFYFFLIAFLFQKKFKKQKLIISIFFISFLIILIIYPFPSSVKELKVTFIDVGQGESILIEFPGNKKMLVDGGGTFDDSFDIGGKIVCPFLWSKGIKKIDYLVYSHAHPDHINGLKSVVKNFKIGEIWESVSPIKDKFYNKFLSCLPKGKKPRKMFRGMIIKEGKVKIEILHPEKTVIEPAFVHNNQSLVMRISYGSHSFLLTGDIDSLAEAEILKYFKNIESTVLKSAHHGSKTSSSEEFLQRVRPIYVVISVGEGNRFNLPDEEILERYNKYGIKILRTDRDGAIELSTNGKKLKIRKAVKFDKSNVYDNILVFLND